MKIVLPNISVPISIERGRINSILIENPKVLFETLSSLSNQASGHDGEIVLSNDGKILNISKEIELITNLIPFEINQKTLVSKIISNLEQQAESSEFYMQTQEIVAKINSYLEDLAFSFPFQLDYTKLSIDSILKTIGIEIHIDGETLAEQIYEYMEIVNEILGPKLYIFYNLRSLIEENELERLLKSAMEHELSILLIESSEYPLLSNEKRYIVDKDLCEIS